MSDAKSPSPLTSSSPLLSLTGVSKRYGGVRALSEVDFACHAGSIHAVLGENGAGKSTLIKIMSGVVQPDEGRMSLAGAPVRFATPSAANAAGVVCIFQELSLVPDLSVAANICLGGPPRRFGMIDGREERRRAEALLAGLGCDDVHPLSLVKDLPLSRRQMVEIAKALGQRPSLLILDEATSALTRRDVETVYAKLKALREQGLAILYISHRMHEIEALADTASVFRNGRRIETFPMGAKSNEAMVELMIGREIASQYPPRTPRQPGAFALETHDLSWNGALNGVSVAVRAGEIVGLGGLDGQGQKELLLALFGVLRGLKGQVRVNGRPARIDSPAAAKASPWRLALIPEDRKTEGLMLSMSIADNLVAASWDRISKGPFIAAGKMRRLVAEAIETLQIKLGSPDDAASTLSGGNQQKIVIAKWLMAAPRVILLNDPTRGIDVGTKQEIYRLMRRLADDGAAILFYSTDYDELIGCCDRVAIFYDGRIVRELEGDEITEQAIVSATLNLTTQAAA